MSIEGQDNQIFEMMIFKEQTGCKCCNGSSLIIDTKTGEPYKCKACQGTGTASVPFCEADDAT